jgi:hypothetical protein
VLLDARIATTASCYKMPITYRFRCCYMFTIANPVSDDTTDHMEDDFGEDAYFV